MSETDGFNTNNQEFKESFNTVHLYSDSLWFKNSSR
jgi:hypothetical protein